MSRLYIATQSPLWDRLIAEAIEHFPDITLTSSAQDADITIGAESFPWPITLYQLQRELQTGTAAQPINLQRGIVFKPEERRIDAAEMSIELTEKEAKLLQLLVNAGAEGLSKEQLLTRVWGYTEGVDTHTLETHIHRLRGKMKELKSLENNLITTMEGYGWVKA